MNSNANDTVFLNRLTSIVEENLGDENFGVSELAQKAGMSRSRLYVRIKMLTQKSASQFIREIRLNKGMELLKQRTLTVSEISYQVGFGSPTYFNNCFHKYFGFSPGEAKSDVKAEPEPELQAKEPILPGNIAANKSYLFIGVFIVVVVFFGVYLFYHNYSSKSMHNSLSVNARSIAVLPLKNLSNNPEIQYLADGIMEDILSRLSHVDGLIVKSRISSEKIGSENLTASEIAKELNVGYFLEGSIMPENEKIRVSVQLISAKSDKHVWANHFDKDLTEILPFVTEVSRHITDQLELILSPEEKGQIEKIYTVNKEAYKLYLEGRFYYQLRTKESFEKSIEVFNQALALDSNFCLAYAGLADSYVTSTFNGFIPKETGIPKSRSFALKALKLDNNLAEAHATLGAIATYFDYNWDAAERELNKAIKINPNYVRAYKLYSEYMDVIGDGETARQYIDKAMQLNPSYANLYQMSFHSYLWGEDFDNALDESYKVFCLDKNEAAYYWREFKIRLLQDRMPEAIDAYVEYRKLLFPNDDTSFIEKLYANSGKEDFIRFVVNAYKKNIGIRLDVAEFYALLNEKDSAMSCLENSFEGRADYAWIKYDPFFGDLIAEPRFITLLRKMNLANEVKE